jgi:hypothetical protein
MLLHEYDGCVRKELQRLESGTSCIEVTAQKRCGHMPCVVFLTTASSISPATGCRLLLHSLPVVANATAFLSRTGKTVGLFVSQTQIALSYELRPSDPLPITL